MGGLSVWAALRARSVHSVMGSAAEGWQPPSGALPGQEPYKAWKALQGQEEHLQHVQIEPRTCPHKQSGKAS